MSGSSREIGMEGSSPTKEAVERLRTNCQEKQGENWKTVFLELPAEGVLRKFPRLKICGRSGISLIGLGYDKFDPQHAVYEAVSCVVKFPTFTNPRIRLLEQIEREGNIPLCEGYTRGGSPVFSWNIQMNSLILFQDGTADLVEEKEPKPLITAATPQLLELLTKTVSLARVLRQT